MSYITRYDQMPIPPVEAQTEYFDAGVVRFGVEYRLLNDAIAAASAIEVASGNDRGAPALDDRGVSIHVFAEVGGRHEEVLRFDCFQEDPHYHYVSWGKRSNEMIHMDPIADGDPLHWALERLRTRLPQMLERAGAVEAAGRLDSRRVDALLPRVAEAAFRARYHHDDDAVQRDAVAAGGR